MQNYCNFKIFVRGELGLNSPDVEHTKGEMKSNVIDFLEELIQSLKDDKDKNPSSWPNLHPINVNSTSLSFTDLWPEGNEETFIVVERADSYIGKEVAICYVFFIRGKYVAFLGDSVNLEERRWPCG